MSSVNKHHEQNTYRSGFDDNSSPDIGRDTIYRSKRGTTTPLHDDERVTTLTKLFEAGIKCKWELVRWGWMSAFLSHTEG